LVKRNTLILRDLFWISLLAHHKRRELATAPRQISALRKIDSTSSAGCLPQKRPFVRTTRALPFKCSGRAIPYRPQIQKACHVPHNFDHRVLFGHWL
jgi:hypothetical protein